MSVAASISPNPSSTPREGMPPRRSRPSFVARLTGRNAPTDPASANRDVNIHALVFVRVDGAPQLVAAFLEDHHEGGRLAWLNCGGGLLVDTGPFDGEIVRSLTGVVHQEGVRAGRKCLGGQTDRIFLLGRHNLRAGHGGASGTGPRRCRP